MVAGSETNNGAISALAASMEPCTRCAENQDVSTHGQKKSNCGGDRPVKVTYTERPMTSPHDFTTSTPLVLHTTQRARDRARRERSQSVVEGLLALVFCILGTFLLCLLTTVFGTESSRQKGSLTAGNTTIADNVTLVKEEKTPILRATRVVGN